MDEIDPVKILIIEDNEINMELVADLLEYSGFTVYRGKTAEEGISLAQKFIPALILMDISLPVMDGLEATQLLKAGELTSDIPIVALSANAMEQDEASALNAGCDGYITKPIKISTFVDTITEYFTNGKVR